MDFNVFILTLTLSRLRLAKQATPAPSSQFNAYGSAVISPGTHTSTTVRLPSSIPASACHLSKLLPARTPVYTLPHLTARCAPEPAPASKVPIFVRPEFAGMKTDRGFVVLLFPILIPVLPYLAVHPLCQIPLLHQREDTECTKKRNIMADLFLDLLHT